MVTCSLLLILIVLICEINVNNLKSTTASDHNNNFKFKIIDNNKVNVALNQNNNPYTEGTYCAIRSQDFTTNFELKDDLKDVESLLYMNHRYPYGPSCVVPCSPLDLLIKFGDIMPKALYWSLGIGTSHKKAYNSVSGEEVYGLETPPIYKELFELEINEWFLDVQMHICENIVCALKYNEVEFNGFSRERSRNCVVWNQLEYENFMVPGYILECPSYPKLFLNTTNQKFYNYVEAYKPQFNVYYDESGGGNNFYHIHFNTFYSDEICRFSYRVADGITATNSWISNCDEKGSSRKCYALCKDVKLFDESTYFVFIEVKIKTRLHLSINSPDMIDRDSPIRKTIVWKRDSAADLIIYQVESYFIINGRMIRLLSPRIQIQRWGFDYCRYSYSMHSICVAFAQCDDIGNPRFGVACDLNTDQQKISELPMGTPLILGIYLSDGQSYFEDYVYVLTPTNRSQPKQFSKKKPQAIGSNILITAVDDDIAKLSYDIPTCIYLVSPAFKNLFGEAKCDNNHKCRGFCNATQNIVGLVAGKIYDIRVIANTTYGGITYDSIQIDPPQL